ncbi:MAG TPA: hypothetical protein VFN30_10820 [Chitinophagaceae bacterium]|nr:hypothetical protein [Chitinophagaceae bacterium]
MKFLIKKNLKGILFIFFFLAGLALINKLALSLSVNHENFGKKVIAIYIPLFFTLFYYILLLLIDRYSNANILLTLSLFFFLTLLFLPYLNDTVEFVQDDSGREVLFATTMIEKGTLHGSDDVLRNTHLGTYIYQPGYRYFLAGCILLSGGVNRLLQINLQMIFLLSVIFFTYKISVSGLQEQIKRKVYYFLLLMSPVSVQMVVHGLTEWLVVIMWLFFVGIFLTNQRSLLAIIILALIPFVRQNLILFIVALFLFVAIRFKFKWYYWVVFFIVLLLPVYHNYYYAGKWAFFANYYNQSTKYLNFRTDDNKIIQNLVKAISRRIFNYSGINFWPFVIERTLMALCFLPYSLYFIYTLVSSINKPLEKIIIYLLALFLIGPTLVLGDWYYPRFEWVNMTLIIGTLLIWLSFSNRILFIKQNN